MTQPRHALLAMPSSLLAVGTPRCASCWGATQDTRQDNRQRVPHYSKRSFGGHGPWRHRDECAASRGPGSRRRRHTVEACCGCGPSRADGWRGCERRPRFRASSSSSSSPYGRKLSVQKRRRRIQDFWRPLVFSLRVLRGLRTVEQKNELDGSEIKTLLDRSPGMLLQTLHNRRKRSCSRLCQTKMRINVAGD